MIRRIWLDVETSGLDHKVHSLLEVGIVVADMFNVVDQRNWLIKTDVDALPNVRPRVVEMHTANGLFDELRAGGGMSMDQVEADIISWLEYRMPFGQPWKLAGSSIHFDRECIGFNMPKFENRLHYRMLDVSSIKESLSDWAPALVDARPKPNALHRALPDCLDSLEEWKYYKTVLLGDA